MPQHNSTYIHTWDYCGHCESPFVRCRKCGNNSCNGGYGLDGECDACPSAYEMQLKEQPPEFPEEYKFNLRLAYIEDLEILLGFIA